jgi:hypothetical protein
MTLVSKKDKRSGITYAYESKPYWDKGKKQSRSNKTLIGRVSTESDIIVPTNGRIRKKRENSFGFDGKSLPDRYFYRATYLLDRIGENLGLIDEITTCFQNQSSLGLWLSQPFFPGEDSHF